MISILYFKNENIKELSPETEKNFKKPTCSVLKI